jgi:hypothetical protein
MTTSTSAVTVEELKARAAALGVTVREDKWEEVHGMMDRALSVLNSFDSADLQALEPTVIVRTVPAGG